MSKDFKDLFTRVADNYASYRPTYPQDLFDWLAAQAPGRALAWDCAAGSGQASVDLAQRFERVRATDASAAQIAQAEPHPSIDYAVAPCEQSGLADASVDLVTVAQALHWFDLPAFYAEARRVLRPGGLIAAWSYGVQGVDGGPIDAEIGHFYGGVVGPYWPPERAHVESGYRTLDFPFAEMDTPEFTMTMQWNLEQLLGYFSSWSATGRYKSERGDDPIPALRARLAPLWGEPNAPRTVTWPLAMRAGRA